MSAGSGAIIDAEPGDVLTNLHVVGNGDRILVTLRDRQRLKQADRALAPRKFRAAWPVFFW